MPRSSGSADAGSGVEGGAPGPTPVSGNRPLPLLVGAGAGATGSGGVGGTSTTSVGCVAGSAGAGCDCANSVGCVAAGPGVACTVSLGWVAGVGSGGRPVSGLTGLTGCASADPTGLLCDERYVCAPAQRMAAMTAPTNAGVTLIIFPRRTGTYAGALKPSKSASAAPAVPAARGMYERAPLMQSGQTSLPLSSTSWLNSVGRPQTA